MPDAAGDRGEVGIALGVADEKPVARRRLASREAARGEAVAPKAGGEILGDRPPFAGDPRELRSVAGDAILRGKGGSEDEAPEDAAFPAGGELAERVAAEERVDLLQRDAAIGEIGQQAIDDGLGAAERQLAGLAVEGEAGSRRRRALTPDDDDRPGLGCERRSRIQRPGKVVGQYRDLVGRHPLPLADLTRRRP